MELGGEKVVFPNARAVVDAVVGGAGNDVGLRGCYVKGVDEIEEGVVVYFVKERTVGLGLLNAVPSDLRDF